jgi:hypothetical protein
MMHINRRVPWPCYMRDHHSGLFSRKGCPGALQKVFKIAQTALRRPVYQPLMSYYRLRAEHCAQMAKDAVDPRRRSALETESRLWLQIAVTEEDLDGLRKKAKNLLNARASQKVDSSRSG